MAQDACAECKATIELIYYVRMQMYAVVSCMVLMVYDHLHTLPMEIEYMWSRKLTRINVLYYITKYGIFFSVVELYRYFDRSITVQKCQYTVYIYSIFMLFSLWAGEVVLGIRIWAIWGKKRYLTISLSIIFWALFITNVVVVLDYAGSIEYGQSPAPQFVNCFVTKANNSVFLSLVCIPAWVALMFILLTTSAYLAYRSGGNTQFVRMMYQEGITYYFYLLLLHGGNLVIFYKAPIASVLSTPVSFLHIALASRVILHIREQAHRRLTMTHTINEERLDMIIHND